MVLLLQYTLIFASVLILVALGGCFSEHSGVINLGLEGIMIMGALGGALTMRYLADSSSALLIILAVILVSALVGMLYSCLLAVACILTLAWFAVRASRTGRSSFYTIAACAAGSLLVFQTSLNVFGSVDLLPLTGVTFPFVSNGGSAMLSAWGLLAYLKTMDTRADASFAIGRAAERKLDEEAARMAAPAEDAFEKEDGHAED